MMIFPYWKYIGPEKLKKSAENFVEKKLRGFFFLQTLEIPKKLLQIYCCQNFLQ